MSRRKNEKYLGFGVSTGGSQGRRAAAQAGQAEGSLTSEQEDQMERDRWVVSSVSDPYSFNPDPGIRIQKAPESGSKLFPNTAWNLNKIIL